jgi:uroporphyrinogen decarboxylase
MQISFTPEFASRLGKDLELSGDMIQNPHGGGNTYELEKILDQDLILTSVGWANSYYKEPGNYIDDWGIGWKTVEYNTPYGKGHYTEFATHPLVDENKIASYQAPDPNLPELYIEAQRVIRQYKHEYWIVGVTVTTIFECAWALRGYEKLLMDLVLDPDIANQILDIPYHYHLTAAKKLVELGVDMIWVGDDVGAQRKMIISPEIWRKFLKPRMANFIAELNNLNSDIKIAYHSDGNIYPIIPELIEIGIDVLNPIQPASMDPSRLKEEFGDRLCFWGTIDEQNTLPFGTAQDVRDEVITRLKTIGKNGGLIIGPTHHVQLDTPLKNFWSMVNTITSTSYTSI